MILHIDTTEHQKIKIAISENGEFLVKRSRQAKFNQAEILLPMIDKILKDKKIKLKDVKKIKIENRGGGFTASRIGVATANALAFGLRIPVEAEEKSLKPKIKAGIRIIEPVYSSEPKIG